jgi:hypothetical protein
MSTQISYRKGTAAQNDAFTGALAEITVDTTNKTLRVHDGATQGGSNIATVAYVDNSIASLSANSITDGNSSVVIVTADGNIRSNVGGGTVQLLTSSGANITGYLDATGNITASNLLTVGIVSATGNVSGGNLNAVTGVSASTVTATGNITGGNLVTAGLVSATGNVSGGNLVTSGNIVAGNLRVTGIESVGVLTVNADATIVGNLTVQGTTVTANVNSLVVTDPVLGLGRGANGAPLTSNDGLDRGTEMFYFTDAEQIAFMGFDNSEGKMISASNVSISNNVVTVNNFGTTTVGTLETSGIVNTNANGVGNIGAADSSFNTVFAKATSAQYADLAEKYLSDQGYAPGTVLEIGGSAEVTAATTYASSRVAGVVSTDPAFIMNAGARGQHIVTVALLGRVPCQVSGPIQRGDLLTSSNQPGVAVSLKDRDHRPGCVLGKALQDYLSPNVGVIEILVGRL